MRLHEYEMSKELAKRLEEKFDIQYSDAEIYEMTLLIISRATNIDYQSIDANNLEQFVGKECLELVKELINDINAFYYIDLSEQEFLIRFALHIKNLLVRSKNNYFSKNPLTESIKLSCPLIYDASVNLARTIKSKTGISINDDEIAYIAFHLGSALETQKNLTSKVKAVLYCPNYYGINSRITDAIYNDFENDLLITNILTDESQIDKVNDIDLVITTIPLATPIQIPTIRINIILNNRDISNLRNRISEIQTQKKKNEFEQIALGAVDTFFREADEASRNINSKRFDERFDRMEQTNELVHGSYNYHNVFLDVGNGGNAVTNFEKCHNDCQVADLYQFLRKVMEKHDWNINVAYRLVDEYDRLKPLEDDDIDMLVTLLSFPEKFWKIINQYYNAGKAWVPAKNIDKLKIVIEQNMRRRELIDKMCGM